MAEKRVVVLVCDFCDAEEDVARHEVAVDGKAVEVDACPRCWRKFVPAWERIELAGRALKRKRQRV